MKIVYSDTPNNQVKTGDIVKYHSIVCMVINHENTTYLEGKDGLFKLEYPIMLVDINSGKVVDAFKTLKNLNSFKHIRILSKNKDAIIQISGANPNG